MYDDLLAFLATERCFIEAEARPDKMMRFLNEYNNAYGESLTLQSNGLIVLQPDADKWAVELRLYVNNCPDTIRTQYGFEVSNPFLGDIIKQLFKMGYRIGLN